MFNNVEKYDPYNVENYDPDKEAVFYKNYSDNNWYSSYLRIPFVYTHRPPVEDWDLWRDAYFESEMQNWLDFIDFWMEGELR